MRSFDVRKTIYLIPLLFIVSIPLLVAAEKVYLRANMEETPGTRFSGNIITEVGYKGGEEALTGGRMNLRGEGTYSVDTSLTWRGSDIDLGNLYFSFYGDGTSLSLGRMPIRLSEIGNFRLDGMDIKWKEDSYEVLYGKRDGKDHILAGRFSMTRKMKSGKGEISGSVLKGISEPKDSTIGLSAKLPFSENFKAGLSYDWGSDGDGGLVWTSLRMGEIALRGSYLTRNTYVHSLERFNVSLSFPIYNNGMGSLIYSMIRENKEEFDHSTQLNLRLHMDKGARLTMELPIFHKNLLDPSKFQLGLFIPIDSGDMLFSYGKYGDVKVKYRKRFKNGWCGSFEGGLSGIKIGADFRDRDGLFWSSSLNLSGDGLNTYLKIGKGNGAFIFNTSDEEFYAGVNYTTDISWNNDQPIPRGDLSGRLFYEYGGSGAGGVRLLLGENMETYTDDEGMYIFKDIPDGTYVLTIDKASISARYGPVDGWTRSVKIQATESINLDISLVSLSSVEGRVFVDGDGDFSWSEGEELSYPVVVTLEPLGKSVVTSRGMYRFTGLLPGVYRVRIDEESLGQGYRARSTPERGVALAPGESVKGIDFIVEQLTKPTVKHIF